MLGRVLILVLWMAWLCSPVFAKDVIAVLEPSGPLDRSILMKLSDESRAAAVNTLPKDDYRVITRENMVLILRDMGVDPSCVEGECEVETGRNVGAKYVISGSVIHVRNTWMFTLKLHETDKGSLLGTSEARGPDELVLIDQVQEATRALIGQAILGDESAAAVGPTAIRPDVPAIATANVDFGGGSGGLGVAERLRQQRCDESAKVKGEKVRAGRLATAEQDAQSKARTAWSRQSAELEMCASLKRAERDGCIEAVNAWLGVARAMVVSIPAGVEPIETECGSRLPVYEAVDRAVVASDVKAAEHLLIRLRSTTPQSRSGLSNEDLTLLSKLDLAASRSGSEISVEIERGWHQIDRKNWKAARGHFKKALSLGTGNDRPSATTYELDMARLGIAFVAEYQGQSFTAYHWYCKLRRSGFNNVSRRAIDRLRVMGLECR